MFAAVYLEALVYDFRFADLPVWRENCKNGNIIEMGASA